MMVFTKNVIGVITWIFIALITAGVQANTPHIAVSIHPIKLIASDLFGDTVAIEQIMSASADPHHHHLTFSQVQTLRQADRVFWMGDAMEVSLSKIMQQNPQAIALLPGVLNKEAAPDARSKDPHVWMNPDYGIAIAEQLTEALVSLHPEQRETWRAKLESFRQRIQGTDAIISKRLLTLEGLRFIASHNAYQHFSVRYNLKNIGNLHDHTGVKIGPRSQLKLQQEKVNCIISEPEYRDSARKMATKLGVHLIEIDPLGREMAAGVNAYQDFLLGLAKKFEECAQSVKN